MVTGGVYCHDNGDDNAINWTGGASELQGRREVVYAGIIMVTVIVFKLQIMLSSVNGNAHLPAFGPAKPW